MPAYLLAVPFPEMVHFKVAVCGCASIGHARAVGSTAADLQHNQVGTEEEPAGCAGRSQVLRLCRWQRQAKIPQFLFLG